MRPQNTDYRNISISSMTTMVFYSKAELNKNHDCTFYIMSNYFIVSSGWPTDSNSLESMKMDESRKSSLKEKNVGATENMHK